jgi:hypothetical protein
MTYFKNGGEAKLRAPLGKDGQLITVNDKEFFDYVTSYYPLSINE